MVKYEEAFKMGNKVLVTDAEISVALAIIRSLGRRRINSICVSHKKRALSFFSKYCNKALLVPSPEKDPEKFISAIIDICKNEEISVVFPIRGPSTLMISKYKKEIENYTIVPFEDYEKLKKVYDKSSLIEVTSKIGIPTPKTWVVDNFDDIKNISQERGFPLVLKASKSEGTRGVRYVRNKKELIEKYNKLKSMNSSKILLQEYIRGIGYGCSVLFNFKSQPRAVFCHKRLRENPPTGGPSVARISIKWPKLEHLTLKLMKYFKWRGIAMIEYKVTSDKKPYLMEINPRFWGSLPLAIASGVDFPYMLFRMAVDGDVRSVRDYKEGIVTRRLIPSDIKVFPYYLLHSKSKLKFIKDYLNFFGENVHYDILSRDDPLPTFGRIVDVLRDLVNRRKR